MDKSCPISFAGLSMSFPVDMAGLQSILGDPLGGLGIPNPIEQLKRVVKMIDPEAIRQETLNGLNSLADAAAQAVEEAAKEAVAAAQQQLQAQWDEWVATADSYVQQAEAVAQGIVDVAEDFEGFASTALCSAAGEAAGGFAASLGISSLLSGDDNGIMEKGAETIEKLEKENTDIKNVASGLNIVKVDNSKEVLTTVQELAEVVEEGEADGLSKVEEEERVAEILDEGETGQYGVSVSYARSNLPADFDPLETKVGEKLPPDELAALRRYARENFGPPIVPKGALVLEST